MNSKLLAYISIMWQVAIALAISVYAGWWLDEKIKLSFPLFLITLPIFLIIGFLIKIVRDNRSKK